MNIPNHSKSNLDTLTRIVREIADSELTDPKLEARIGDDEAYEEWGRGVGALSLLGKPAARCKP